MKLATFSINDIVSYGAVVPTGIIDLGRRYHKRHPDLKALLAGRGLDDVRLHLDDSPDYQVSDVTWLPVIPNPEKIVCVGLNYEDHRVEAGLSATDNPALFLRTAESQVGHNGAILRPCESDTLDYEAEIAVIIGKQGRRISQAAAWRHIAGYSCYNDGSVREWQRHTLQYTAGKNFASTGGFGPWMVTADEIPPNEPLTLTCRLNGEVVQQATTQQMIFSIPRLITYISTFTTLQPGDVIVTGTPAGVGSRRTPPIWLRPGDEVEVEIDQVGILRNSVADD
ncbi:fumarylacetoacetate hydrolase family protein [Micromonospora sp. NPDC047707]|uniref:fumarylacetoacetate hydrolase family protein n=1 Tax=Micromonospora sp. NPDC047707 TaxID=3154498 RepID=UPI003453C3B4